MGGTPLDSRFFTAIASIGSRPPAAPARSRAFGSITAGNRDFEKVYRAVWAVLQSGEEHLLPRFKKAVDALLERIKKPNDKPYSDGAPYTGKEHSWDEAFGYFGAPAHALMLSPQQIYDIAKQKPEVFAAADHDGDGKVDLLREMTFGPAYYAAGFDADGKTSYLQTIVGAFLDGRKLLAEAKGEALTDAQRAALKAHAATIATAWQQVLAEAVFKYAGSVYKDIGKLNVILEANGDPAAALEGYVHHWGELKGFAMALQSGRENLGETAVRLNRLLGYGPVLANQSQVTGISSTGEYIKGEGTPLAEYMLHMLKTQQLMVEAFGVKARQNDQLADLQGLAKQIGAGGNAEND